MASTIDISRQKLYLPLNEAKGSSTAYDYSLNRYDATINGTAYLDSAREGNGAYFPDGAGTVDVEHDPITLTGDWTIMFWALVTRLDDGRSGAHAGIAIATENDIHDIWVDARENAWGQWAISKSGNIITAYLNNMLLDTITVEEPVTGISLVQDIYDGANGYGAIDEVRIYDIALTRAEIMAETQGATEVEYSIAGHSLRDWDIFVSESDGLLDRPKMKSPRSISWDNYHGEVVDLRDKRVQPREITLSCFMRAKGKLDFINKLNDFLKVFDGDGTQRLTVDVHPTKPLIYEVYNEAGTAIKKRWNDEIMVGTFQLKLREPDPVKRIIRHASKPGSRVLTINMTTRLAVTISWGDGTTSEDVFGTALALTHTYAQDGIYYAVISGVIEKIENFTTNGIVVWEKL